MRLVCFIIRTYHDVRSSECQTENNLTLVGVKVRQLRKASFVSDAVLVVKIMCMWYMKCECTGTGFKPCLVQSCRRDVRANELLKTCY